MLAFLSYVYFTRKSNGPCVTEVQCTLQRGELALCTNNRIRGQSIARLKLPVDIALKRKQVLVFDILIYLESLFKFLRYFLKLGFNLYF
jgi:hypothetical protein